MSNVFVTQILPSLPRLFSLLYRINNVSLFRALTYEALESKKVGGFVLDIGGGCKTNYYNLLSRWGIDARSGYHSINIDKSIVPTFLVEEDGIFPIMSNSYETVTALNTFEHIYNVDLVISEAFRVLKNHGEILIVVPFIFRVHGHPNDYFRGTPAYWHRKLKEFSFTKINVTALSWGNFSTGASISGMPGPMKYSRMALALIFDLIRSKIKHKGRAETNSGQDSPDCSAPLGYMICAQKII